MKTYVRVEDLQGALTVVEVIQIEANQHIRDFYHSEFIKLLIDVSAHDPAPQQWWTYDGNKFVPPAA